MKPNHTKSVRPTFVFTGDSLTEGGADVSLGGWTCLLQQEYIRVADIINHGLCGYNTSQFVEHALPALQVEWEAKGAPTFITLWLGANDAAVLSSEGAWQNVPIETFKKNLFEIVSFYKKHAPNAHILVMTPPPIAEETRILFVNPIDRTTENSIIYTKACLEVAKEAEVECLDLCTTILAMDNWKKLFNDGLHFTKEGNQVVFELVRETIKQKFPQLVKEAIGWQLPEFWDFKPTT